MISKEDSAANYSGGEDPPEDSETLCAEQNNNSLAPREDLPQDPPQDPRQDMSPGLAKDPAQDPGEDLRGASLFDMPPEDDPELRARLYQLCRDYVRGEWMDCTMQDFVVKKVSGGLSNQLYYCSRPSIQDVDEMTDDRILIRLYGQMQEEANHYVTEAVITTLLSETNRGPRLLGVFPGGRIEEYLQARALLTAELADSEMSRLIAIQMANIHRMDIPISKEPSWLWQTMDKWLQRITTLIEDPDIPEKFQDMLFKLARFRLKEEMEWLKPYLISVGSPVVFCHNDMQEGNILLKACRKPEPEGEESSEARKRRVARRSSQAGHGAGGQNNVCSEPGCSGAQSHTGSHDQAEVELCEVCGQRPGKRQDDAPGAYNCLCDNCRCKQIFTTNKRAPRVLPPPGVKELVVIDYEYCAYNYRGFDLANHMCEWMYDYSNELPPFFFERPGCFPTQAQQDLFARSYVEAFHDGALPSHMVDAAVANILDEIRSFTLCSHFFWGLWAVVNSVATNITFDYWGYGETRFEAYFRHKEALGLTVVNSNNNYVKLSGASKGGDSSEGGSSAVNGING